PDSGTSFTWSAKAFNPWIGWMGGWGLISATVIVLSNLAAVAVDFFYILLAQIFQNPSIAAWTDNLLINIPTTLLFTAIAAWVAYRGLATTQKLQYLLVSFQVLVLIAFAIAALVQAQNGSGFDPTPVSWDWFNPAEIGDFSVFAAGLSLSIFMFWGWDAVLTMNEETRNPEKTPGRAATLTISIIITLYILVTVGVIAWAGIGDQGLGARHPDNRESIFAALSGPIFGPFAILMSVAILAASFASLQTTMISPSRTILAMGYYKAFPPASSKISPRFRTPSVATIVSAVATGGFYTITRL